MSRHVLSGVLCTMVMGVSVEVLMDEMRLPYLAVATLAFLP
jgi:hypothetical protein